VGELANRVPATEIARSLWERIEARDWEGARELLADGMVCRWPHSDERFEGADDFIAMNRAYPEGWRITIIDVADIPGGAVSRIRVDQSGIRFHAASFFEVRDGQIHEAVEYWVTEGSEEPPAWRARFSDRPSGLP
jgi:ketosteroid isomerase-like protein